MSQIFKNRCLHLVVFIVIEIIFVFLLFKEIPETNLITTMGILHTSYRFILLIAGRIRTHVTHTVRQKFLCTYIPVVYHVLIHIYTANLTITHIEHQHNHHESLARLWTATIGVGILIWLGEYRLHRTRHCDTHHHTTHQHCHDTNCEQTHH